MTPEEETKILKDCIDLNRCNPIVICFQRLVYSIVRKTFVLKGARPQKEDVEEVCQDVFVQLFDDDRRRLRLYVQKEGHSLTRWIVVIATHTTLNFLRKKGFDSLFGQYGRQELDADRQDAGNPETTIINNLAFNKAIDTLSPNDRIIIKLYRFGMTARDTAAVMDSTEAYINNRISFIKKRLRQSL